MKTVLFVSLNAKYIHLSPAPYLLAGAAEAAGYSAGVLDLNINMPLSRMIRRVCAANARVIGFSCHIYSVALVKKIAEAVKKARPDVFILFGGPEVQRGAALIALCDAAVMGEGEPVLPGLLSDIFSGKIGCGHHELIDAPSDMPLSALPDIWQGYAAQAESTRIAYYESSRGCPFACSYCMSSQSKGVRYKDVDTVIRQIGGMLKSPLRQIKFCDRTFNSDTARAAELVRRLTQAFRGRHVNFHFEMAPDRFDEPLMGALEAAPKGLFQLEIGVQSFTPEALSAVRRAAPEQRVKDNIKRLCAMDNMHIHTDLIAGLPGETPQRFAESFDKLYALGAHQLQLGFLKILPGSPLAAEAERLGIQYASFPPYEVISTPHMPADALDKLRDIASAVDMVHNSGRHTEILKQLLPLYPSSFAFFEAAAAALDRAGLFDRGASPDSVADCLLTLYPSA